jgi:ribosomal protein S27E
VQGLVKLPQWPWQEFWQSVGKCLSSSCQVFIKFSSSRVWVSCARCSSVVREPVGHVSPLAWKLAFFVCQVRVKCLSSFCQVVL